MWPYCVSNPGPLAPESDMLQSVKCSPAIAQICVVSKRKHNLLHVSMTFVRLLVGVLNNIYMYLI